MSTKKECRHCSGTALTRHGMARHGRESPARSPRCLPLRDLGTPPSPHQAGGGQGVISYHRKT